VFFNQSSNRPITQGLNFLHGSNRADCDATVGKHFEGYYTVQLITRGHVDVSYDDTTWRLSAGYFWFHFPGPYTRVHVAEGPTWHHRHLAVNGPLAEEWRNLGLLEGPPVLCPAERRTELTARFDQILGWAGESGQAPRAKARAALELLLWEIWEIRNAPEEHHAVLEALAEFAESRRFRVGSYEALAKRLALSGSTLRRRVREATGLPLHQYTRFLRLNEARRLLRHTDKPLAEVAATLGFTDEYYFNREFSRLAGLPPGAYRQSLM
jgi:AraC-like DNA-binding protein